MESASETPWGRRKFIQVLQLQLRRLEQHLSLDDVCNGWKKKYGSAMMRREADSNFILSWICKQDKEIPTHMYERSLIHLCIPLEIIKSLFSRAGVITLHPSYYWVAQYTIPHHSSQLAKQSRSQSNLTVIKAEGLQCTLVHGYTWKPHIA